jgi:hypothetical protein
MIMRAARLALPGHLTLTLVGTAFADVMSA